VKAEKGIVHSSCHSPAGWAVHDVQVCVKAEKRHCLQLW